MRVAVRTIVGLIVLLLIAWIVLWWVVQAQMQARFDKSMDRLTAQGFTVTHGPERRGASPLAATLTVPDLMVTIPSSGRTGPVTVSLPQVSGRIDVANPFLLHVGLPNRISLSEGGAMSAVVSFGAFDAVERLNPGAVFDRNAAGSRGGTVNASDVNLLASGSLLVLHIDRITAQTAFDRQADASRDLLAVQETFDGFALSPLLAHLVAAPFNGAIPHLALAVHVSGPAPKNLDAVMAQLRAAGQDEAAQQRVVVPVVHDWAQANGHAWFNAAIVQGPSTLTADGNVAFDANQQPNGKADVTMDHLDAYSAAIVSAYPSAAPYVAQVQAMLTPYLSAGAGGQTLTMHVTYGVGAVTINGQKAASLPAVNWAALANPQATPAPAQTVPEIMAPPVTSPAPAP